MHLIKNIKTPKGTFSSERTRCGTTKICSSHIAILWHRAALGPRGPRGTGINGSSVMLMCTVHCSLAGYSWYVQYFKKHTLQINLSLNMWAYNLGIDNRRVHTFKVHKYHSVRPMVLPGVVFWVLKYPFPSIVFMQKI